MAGEDDSRPCHRELCLRRIAGICIAIGLVVGTLGSAAGQTARPQEPEQAERPNILLIVVDDQSSALFNRTLMPQVHSKIVDRGVKFERAYVNTSQCCPSRAQILTGLYGHHNGVDGNNVSLLHPTIVEALQDQGYRTAIAGKYLNSWPCAPRPEFDYWACIEGSHEHASLVNPVIYVNGRRHQFEGYQTEVLADLVIDFIDETPADVPFFAMYTSTSPHMPANDRRYADLQIPAPRSPSFDEETTLSGKPGYTHRAPLTEAEIAKIDATYRKMARASRGLDESVGRLLDSLGDRADNTLVVYTSDNGFLYGEHRLAKKIVPYEESVRVPLAVRYPALGGAQGDASDALVQNIDIAPTIADLLGVSWGVDGASLLPLLEAPGSLGRDAVLIENCQGESYPCPGGAPRGSRKIPSFWGVVTDDYKYVEYYTGETELYDLASDPFELANLTNDPTYAATKQALVARLAALRQGPVPETTLVSGPPVVVNADSAQFRYFTQIRDGRYRCRLTQNEIAGDWELCGNFTTMLGPLPDGDYLFEVQASINGVVDPTPASRAFTIDADPFD